VKYTQEDLTRMGYRKVGERDGKELYESLLNPKKRITMKKDEKDGKYIWWGVW